MWMELEKEVYAAAERLIREHELHAKTVHDENVRRHRRSTGTPETMDLRRPETWKLDKGFNPYIVRARSRTIAHSIALQLRNRTYTPRPPAGFRIPKPSGGERVVTSFRIADEVVSRLLLRSLTKKNLPQINARAYAYRPDRGAHDAITYIRTEMRREHRLYIAEYDFSKFFDSVNHDALLDVLDRMEIRRTRLEQYLIEKFLRSPEPSIGCYTPVDERPVRKVGLPQGTSLSLFLANVAASELDRSLERLGVGFVRYADDTLIWSPDYGRIGEAVSTLYGAAEHMGVPINAEKSEGIRLLVGDETARGEIKTTKRIEYLGHTIGLRTVGIKKESLDRIKKRIDELLFNNLLREPLAGTQERGRLTDVDRDYVTLIWQLRRYLYGSLSEKEVRRFQNGGIPPMSFEGVMAFFPLVDDYEQLLSLDSWMSTRVWLVMRKRARLLRDAKLPCPPPHGLDKNGLIGFQSPSARTGQLVDLRMPSSHRISRVIRTAIRTHGTGVLMGQESLYLYEN